MWQCLKVNAEYKYDYVITLEMQMLNVSLVVKLKFHLKQRTAPPPIPDSGWENNAGGNVEAK